MSQEQLKLLTLTAQYNKICAEYAKLANEFKKDEEEEKLPDDDEEICNTCKKYLDHDEDDKRCGAGCKEYDDGWKETHDEEEEEEEDFWVACGGDIEVITAKPSEMDNYDEWGSFYSFTDKRKK